MSVSRDLLKILACPETKAPLVLTKDKMRLVSTDPKSRRCYKIEEGIPVLLIDESTILSEEEHNQILEEAKASK